MPSDIEGKAPSQVDVDAQARELLDNIAEAHHRLKRVVDRGGISTSVRVTTAVPMDDELLQAVYEKCEHDFGRPVYIVEHVEPKILGGIIIEALGHRRDASIRTYLVKTRKALASTYVGGDE